MGKFFGLVGLALVIMIPTLLVYRGCSKSSETEPIEIGTESTVDLPTQAPALPKIRRNLILVVDESTSLGRNDPENQQSQLLETFLHLCQTFAPDRSAKETNADRSLSIAVMSFSSHAHWMKNGEQLFWQLGDAEQSNQFFQAFHQKFVADMGQEKRRGPFSDFDSALSLLDEMELPADEQAQTTVFFVTDGRLNPFPGNPRCIESFDRDQLQRERQELFAAVVNASSLSDKQRWLDQISELDLTEANAFEVFQKLGEEQAVDPDQIEHLALQVMEGYADHYSDLVARCRRSLLADPFDARKNQTDFFLFSVGDWNELNSDDQQVLRHLAKTQNEKESLQQPFVVSQSDGFAVFFDELAEWLGVEVQRSLSLAESHQLTIGPEIRAWALLAVPKDSSGKIDFQFKGQSISPIGNSSSSFQVFGQANPEGGQRTLDFGGATGEYLLIAQPRYVFLFNSRHLESSITHPDFEFRFSIYDSQTSRSVNFQELFGGPPPTLDGKIVDTLTGETVDSVEWQVLAVDGATRGWSLNREQLNVEIEQLPRQYEVEVSLAKLRSNRGEFSDLSRRAILEVVPATMVEVEHPKGQKVGELNFYDRNLAPRVW